MGRFTDDQKRIAVALVNSPKTVEELNSQLGLPFTRLNDSLKQMLKLNLVKVEGYPQKYVLSAKVAEGVRRRKEIAEKDPFELRLKATIEIRAVEEVFLKKHMDEIAEKLRKDKTLNIYDIFRAKPLRDGGYFTSYFQVNLSAKDFSSIVRFMYFFGPSSVEVLKPAKVVLPMDDLQDALMEMAEMIQSYNHAMLKSMNKDELANFSKSLYASK